MENSFFPMVLTWPAFSLRERQKVFWLLRVQNKLTQKHDSRKWPKYPFWQIPVVVTPPPPTGIYWGMSCQLSQPYQPYDNGKIWRWKIGKKCRRKEKTVEMSIINFFGVWGLELDFVGWCCWPLTSPAVIGG